MKTLTNTHHEPAANIRSLFPDDLRAWLGASALAASARQAAENFYWVSADDDDPPPFGGCACPLRKLALFTYGYATGNFSTDDLEARLADDETARQLCAGARFPGDKLRLFRAHNSELIKLCLGRVLEQAWAAKFGKAAASDHQVNARPHPGPTHEPERRSPTRRVDPSPSRRVGDRRSDPWFRSADREPAFVESLPLEREEHSPASGEIGRLGLIARFAAKESDAGKATVTPKFSGNAAPELPLPGERFHEPPRLTIPAPERGRSAEHGSAWAFSSNRAEPCSALRFMERGRG